MGESITGWMAEGGVIAVAALMFLENLFPPIPSEIVMPFAGYAAARGDLSLWLAIVAGCVGSLAGAVFWYVIGAWVGPDRVKAFARSYGRILTLAPQDVEKADAWFDKHGGKAVLFGRLVPGVRTFISIPAGMSGMSFRRFMAYSTVGTVAWTAALALAGYWLGEEYERVSGWLSPVSYAVIGLLVAGYLYRVATFGRRRREYDARQSEGSAGR